MGKKYNVIHGMDRMAQLGGNGRQLLQGETDGMRQRPKKTKEKQLLREWLKALSCCNTVEKPRGTKISGDRFRLRTL